MERLWKYAMVVGVIGLILGVVGPFLPWERYCIVHYAPAGPGFEEWDYRIGLDVGSSFDVFVGCTIAMMGLFFLLTGLIRIAPGLIAASGFYITFTTCSWIYPRFTPAGPISPTVLYGAYVTLAGGIITMIAAVLSAVHAIRPKESASRRQELA